jgi:uncharacterized lipoprotein YajG
MQNIEIRLRHVACPDRSRDAMGRSQNHHPIMNPKALLARVLAAGSLLMLAACETPPTVVTQTTTVTETTAVSRGNRLVARPTTVVYPSNVRTVAYHHD